MLLPAVCRPKKIPPSPITNGFSFCPNPITPFTRSRFRFFDPFELEALSIFPVESKAHRKRYINSFPSAPPHKLSVWPAIYTHRIQLPGLLATVHFKRNATLLLICFGYLSASGIVHINMVAVTSRWCCRVAVPAPCYPSTTQSGIQIRMRK